jgi:putative membrane-bound dehydrogenase-like protein
MKSILLAALLLASLSSAAPSPESPIAPRDTLPLFHVAPGVKVELVAAEPQIMSPVSIAFDEHQRMYVAEDRGYPTGPGPGQPPAGKIALLEDENGDGYYEKRTTYAEDLTFPNGVLPWKGGVFVTCAPDLLYLEDTDGDNREDRRTVVLTGFSEGGSTQLQVSHPTLGLDGWIYLTNGLSGGKVFSPLHPDREPVDIRGSDCRYDPETGEIQATAGQAQFGQTFDRYGRRFVCSNRKPTEHVVLPLNALSRNPFFAFAQAVQNVYGSDDPVRLHPISENITTAVSHAGTFTAACGIQVYRGSALPAELHDNIFVCDPTGNLVHRTILKSSGASFRAENLESDPEFLASTDNWFRPVNLANGPDGALYVCDMYRKTIEHPVYLPEEIRKRTDFETGKDRGRIYRLTAAEPPPRLPAPARHAIQEPGDVAGLCELLGDSDVWWRETAQRLLLEKRPATAAGILASMVDTRSSPLARLLALRALDGLGKLGEPQIVRALKDVDPGVRENALQLAEPRLSTMPNLMAEVLKMGADTDARVRFECALALGAMEGPEKIPVLASIATRGLEDRWTRAAMLTAIGGKGDAFLSVLLAKADPHAAGFPLIIEPLGGILGASLTREALAKVLAEAFGSNQSLDFDWQAALVVGILEGLPGKGFGGGKHSPLEGFFAGDLAPSEKLNVRTAAFIQTAILRATDDSAPMNERETAIELLGFANPSEAGPKLESLIDPHQPQEVQIAAIQALGQNPESEESPFLVSKERWHGYTPGVRSEVLAMLLSRSNRLDTLLSALEKEDIQPWSVDASSRSQLLDHHDEAIRERAAKIFEGVEQPDRKKVYEDYLPVVNLDSHPAHGREVFKANCAQCHRLESEGKPVGPDLTGVRTQPREALLLHILIPNHDVAPSFTNYLIETEDGETVTGIIAAETPTSITLRRSQGEEETILRGNIASMRSTNLSLMPQELEKNMSRQDLADLIGYLKGDSE